MLKLILIITSVAFSELNEYEILNDNIFLEDLKQNQIDLGKTNDLLGKNKKKNPSFSKIFTQHENCYIDDDQKVKHLFSLSLPIDIEIEINKIEIKGREFKFNMTDDCRTIYPTKFISAKNQDWLGIKLKKGDLVESFPDRSSDETVFYYGNNYYPKRANQLEFDPKKSKYRVNHLHKTGYTEAPYIEITSKKGKKRAFYQDKFYSDVEQKYDWTLFGITPYFGNKICLNNDSLKIMRASKEMFETGYVSTFTNLNPSEKDIENGRACNRKIAAYEKKTGKKVPFPPKEIFHKELINEIVTNHMYK